MYKKLDLLYQSSSLTEQVTKQLLSTNGGRPLELFHNPKDGPDSNIGVCIGSFSEANTLVGEDAALFE